VNLPTFFRLLRTGANKVGRGGGGAFAVRNGRNGDRCCGAMGKRSKGSSAKPFATPLKPLTPSLKPFYVADEPVEGSEPKGEQKQTGSPQPFDESDQNLAHCRSPAPQSLA
jgi:hypothetical protein